MIRFARNTKAVATKPESKAKDATTEETAKVPVKPAAAKKQRKTAGDGDDQLL